MERPAPPGEENGAHDLDRAFAWLDKRLAELGDTRGDRWTSRYVGPWNYELEAPWHEHATPTQLDELREFLASFGPLYDGVAAATSKPETVWGLGTDALDTCSLGGPISSSGYDDWNTVRQILATRARVAATAAERAETVVWLLEYMRRTRLRTEFDHRLAATYRRLGCLALRDGIEA